METQQAGYIYKRLVEISKSIEKKKVLLVLFGSDLYWYVKLASHRKRITNLMEKIDFLAAEGERDRTIAISLGFRGAFFTDKPVSARQPGLESEVYRLEPPSRRKKIAVKGYSNVFGQGEAALDALEAVLEDDKEKYEIEVFSAEGKALKKAYQLEKSGFRTHVHKKFSLSQREVIQLLSECRLYIGISRSDGLPASFMEALSVGAFPIQTDTSLASDWIQNAETGFIVPPDHPEYLKQCIRIALGDDVLVDQAATTNIPLISTRANGKTYRNLLIGELEHFFES
jgi:glycosyltransferase involved in cell wall biosynthesis